MARRLRRFFLKVCRSIWSLFFNGLITILPISITVALFSITINLIMGWLEPLDRLVDSTPLGDIPHSGIILALAAIFTIGALLNVFLLRTAIHALEGVFFKLPMVRPIYSGIKQIVRAFTLNDQISFKKVVLVEFPRNGIYSVGFLTSELPKELSPCKKGEACFNVFIPTTPNPTSGFFVILPASQVMDVDLTRQEAMALIISGGIIQPRRYMNKEKKKKKK